MDGPLLSARDLRVDAGAGPAVDGLSMRADGERVLVLGAPRELFEATCGARPIARGTLSIRGVDAVAALRAGSVAGAPLDPPLPPTWTSLEYASWRARLAGHGKQDAERYASSALESLGALSTARAALRLQPPHLRRAAVIAGALATKAETIVLEDPLLDLPAPIEGPFARAVLEALRARTWIVFAGRAPLASPLAARADVALLLHGSQVAAAGRPHALAAAATTFSLRLAGDAARFEDLARARGARVAPRRPSWNDDVQITVELASSESGTRVLFDLAHETQTTIVELCPIARAFA